MKKMIILIFLILSCFKNYKLDILKLKGENELAEFIRKGNLELVKKELQKNEIDLLKPYFYMDEKIGYTCNSFLELAAKSGNIKILKEILRNIKKPDLNELISTAACYGNTNIIEYLIKRMLKNSEKPNLDEALYWAAFNGETNTIHYLFKSGAGIEYIDPIRNINSLIATIMGDHLEAFMTLLDLGADVNFKVKDRNPFVKIFMG